MDHIRQRRDAALAIKIATQHQARRLSLHDPLFNLREVAKQLVLLEDHLSHPHKACFDCIRKHLLTIEALAEEATSLDMDGTLLRQEGRVSEMIAEMARLWMENILDNRPLHEVQSDIRRLRKDLSSIVADPRDISQRVASRHLSRRILCPHR